MGEPECIHAQHAIERITIRFHAECQRAPIPVQPISRRRVGTVDLLGVVIHNIGAGVGERPGDGLVEADDDTGSAGDGHPIHVKRVPNDKVRLVPNARQRQLKVRVAGQQRVARCTARRTHGPIVAPDGIVAP